MRLRMRTRGWTLVAVAMALAGAAPARAIEAFDGRLQIHGAGSQEFRIIADGYRPQRHIWYLSKMSTKLSVEIEAELFPEGIGPFDIVEAFARLDVEYDCVWEHACHMAPQWNYFGDDARRWPKNLTNGKTRGVTGVLPNPLKPVVNEQPDRRLVNLTEIDPFETLLSLGSPEDVQATFGDVLGAKFSTKYVRGSLSPLSLSLGPINPGFQIDSTGALADIAAPIQADLPLRPLLDSLFIPSPALRNRISRYDDADVNFTENELEWNLGASQQETKFLREAYLDFTMLDGRLVFRLGKQITRWGKTELFRSGTPDQLNPQDFAISNLPSFEDSLIALWQARAIYSFYQVGPLEDVRLEAVVNLDHFEPNDLGDCGEPYTVFLVCLKQAGLLSHGISGLGVAGERRPNKFWNDPRGPEFGLRLEFRWDRFSFSITDFYGYDDFPTPDWFNTYERNVDPQTGRPRRWGARGPCTDPSMDPACLTEDNAALWHPGNRQLYDTTCKATQNLEIPGDLGSLLPITSCVLSIFNDLNPILPPAIPNVPAVLAQVLGGGDFFNVSGLCDIFCPLIGRYGSALGGTTDMPVFDPNESAIPLHPGLADGGGNFGSLSRFLTQEQEALLGCGPFYNSQCNNNGIDLFNMEASVIFQAFPQTEHLGHPLQGAVGTRWVDRVGLVQLPGTRSVFNYFDDPVGYRWNPNVDGCVVGLGALPDGAAIFDDLVAVQGLTEEEASQCDWDPNPAVNGVWAGDTGMLQGSGYFVPIPDEDPPPGGVGAQVRYFDQTGTEYTLDEIRLRFPNEMAVVSENLARLLIGLAGILPGADPRCSFDQPLYCDFLNALFETSAVQRPERRAGGNGHFGRRDMSWLSGAELDLFYQRRNVLGFSVDFAEDHTQTTWGIDLTWVAGAPYTNNRADHGYSREDTINLTMSIDRPTFINFLNANRTVFFNSQIFLRYIPDYKGNDTFDVAGPFAMLATLTAFTGFWQDRLMTFVTLLHEVDSHSGGEIVTFTYRFSESFSATVGLSSFYGSPQRQRVLRQSPATRFHCCDYTQRTNWQGVSAIAERDEIFFNLRKTF